MNPTTHHPSDHILAVAMSFFGSLFYQVLTSDFATDLWHYIIDMGRALSISVVCAVVGFYVSMFLKRRYEKKKGGN